MQVQSFLYLGMAVGADIDDARIDISLWIFAILVTLINLAIVTVVLHKRNLRTFTNGFIVSLAVSDALTGAVLFPVYILGPEFLIGYTNAIIIFSGVANVCSLSYDRYVAVFKPFRYHQVISKSFKPLVISSWVIPILIGLVPLIWQIADAPLAKRLDRAFVILLVALVVLPHVFIFFVYCRIFVRLRKKSKQKRALKGFAHSQTKEHDHKTPAQGSRSQRLDFRRTTRTSLKEKCRMYRSRNKDSDTKRVKSNDQVISIEDPSGDQEQDSTVRGRVSSFRTKQQILNAIERLSGSKRRDSLRRERDSRAEKRVAKTLAAVVLVFFLSWSPIIYISLAYTVFNSGPVPTALVVFSAFTVAIGSLVNPALYAFLKPDLRNGIAELFCKFRCLRKISRNNHGDTPNRQF